MKKNIAFVIGHLSQGGAEKQIYLLSKGLDKSKYNAVVICLSNDKYPWGDRISDLGIRVVYISRLLQFDITRVFRLYWHLYKYDIDIVLSSLHIANVYSWLARLFYFRKSTYIAQVRSRESNMRGLTKRLNICAFNTSAVIITNSKLLNPFVEKFFNQDKKKIVTINNGIEIQHPTKPIKGKSIVRVGVIGKDTPAKNIDLFIDTALLVLLEYKNLHFDIYGRDLDENSRLHNLIPGDFKSFFSFNGEIDNPNTVYEVIDIYISTSRSEGSPNTILEAMSFGLPVVATDVGGVSELVKHGETGFLVPSGDLDGLVKYCKTLIDDSTLRSRMGQNGRDFISRNYSAEKMVEEFEKIFESVGTN